MSAGACSSLVADREVGRRCSRPTRTVAAPRCSRRTRSLAKLPIRRERGPVNVLVCCDWRGATELLVPRPPGARRPGRRPPRPGVNIVRTSRLPRAAQGGQRLRPLRLLVRRKRALRLLLACGGQGRRPPHAAHGKRGHPLAADEEVGRPVPRRTRTLVGPRGRWPARAEDNVGRPAAIAAEEEVGLLLLLVSALRSAGTCRHEVGCAT